MNTFLESTDKGGSFSYIDFVVTPNIKKVIKPWILYQKYVGSTWPLNFADTSLSIFLLSKGTPLDDIHTHKYNMLSDAKEMTKKSSEEPVIASAAAKLN